MGSRCGDMDPAVVLYMMQKGGLSAHEVDVLMNKKSGFLGMCGHADIRAVLQAADAGDEKAQLAIEVCIMPKKSILTCNHLRKGEVQLWYVKLNSTSLRATLPNCDGRQNDCANLALKEFFGALQVYLHRLRRYMGSYFLQLRGKVDAVVFSAGMGENSAFLRARILEDLDVGPQSPCMLSRPFNPLCEPASRCPFKQADAIRCCTSAAHDRAPSTLLWLCRSLICMSIR